MLLNIVERNFLRNIKIELLEIIKNYLTLVDLIKLYGHNLERRDLNRTKNYSNVLIVISV